jgi:hypothetical protein
VRSKFIALLAACGLGAALLAPAVAPAGAAPASGGAATAAGAAPTALLAARKPNNKRKVPVGPTFNNPMVPNKRFLI